MPLMHHIFNQALPEGYVVGELALTGSQNLETLDPELTNQTVKIRVSGNGAHLFTAFGTKVKRFDFGAAFNPTSLVFHSEFNTGDDVDGGLHLADDGSFFIVGDATGGNFLKKYTMTAFDAATASLSQTYTLPGVNISSIEDFVFSGDGLRAFVVDSWSVDKVEQFNLTTAFNLTTMTAASKNFGFINARGLDTNRDGSRLIIGGWGPTAAKSGHYAYDLGTPGEIDTIVTPENSFLNEVDFSLSFAKSGHTLFSIIDSFNPILGVYE